MKTFPFKKSCRGLIHQTRALRKMKKKRRKKGDRLLFYEEKKGTGYFFMRLLRPFGARNDILCLALG
jgi:hypothetical protein